MRHLLLPRPHNQGERPLGPHHGVVLQPDFEGAASAKVIHIGAELVTHRAMHALKGGAGVAMQGVHQPVVLPVRHVPHPSKQWTGRCRPVVLGAKAELQAAIVPSEAQVRSVV